MVDVVIQRLDKLDAKVDQGLEKLNDKIDAGREKNHERIDRLNENMVAGFNRTFYLVLAVMTALLTGLLGLLAKLVNVI